MWGGANLPHSRLVAVTSFEKQQVLTRARGNLITQADSSARGNVAP